jgi:hypothetical protein
MDIEFENTKGITRSCNQKDRECKDQKTKDNIMGEKKYLNVGTFPNSYRNHKETI